jgi:hypothetical protein
MFENLLDPAILCFVVGLLAGLLRSNLRLPSQVYEALSLYLLFSIGLKGGVELSKAPIAATIFPSVAAITLGVTIPIIAYNILKRLGRFNKVDAAAIAAHYGSVSAVTYAVVLSFLHRTGVSVEPFVTVLLVILEIPAIAVGVFIASKHTEEDPKVEKKKWATLFHEVFLGKTIYLLIAGLFVGYFAGPERVAMIGPVFIDLFKGALAFFLLEMGVITSQRFSELKRKSLFLVGFGILMPILSGSLGCVLGYFSGLSVGGTTVLATLAASASYIAAPAAIRIALPKANLTLCLTASLGITFPFNVVLGIPIYFWMSQMLHLWGG